MNTIKLTIIHNDIEIFLKECEKKYLEDKNIINILKTTIKENKIDFFKLAMEKYLTPQIFWSISMHLVETNNYDFLKVMIKINRSKETQIKKKNDYVNQLLFDFIDKDDLFFVDYLITNEKASTKNNKENELTVLNECIKVNALKCFDYFLAQGKSVHDYQDLALFTALDNKRYDMVEMILKKSISIYGDIEKNFYQYGRNLKKEGTTNKQLLILSTIENHFLEKSTILQNGLTYEFLKRGLYQQVEENLVKGFSPIGDEHHNLIDLALTDKKSVKKIQLLLDYGAQLTENQKSTLSLKDRQMIEQYPRFKKVKEKLEKDFPRKGKGMLKKI